MIRIDPRELRKKVERIVGERSPFSGARHLGEVEVYIEREFRSYGLKVEKDPFTYRGATFRNVIGHAGPDRATALAIVGAHFDSVQGTPGADDNASGVAVMLEAARVLARTAVRSRVYFCAFNLEELNMIGSTHFAKKLRDARAKVRGMISLEMVGYTDTHPGSQRYPPGLSWFYPDRGDFVGIVGNWRSGSLRRHFARWMRQVRGLSVETLTVLANGFLVPPVRLSDHSPFWDLGYPALLITDTSFFRNPHYHAGSDSVETLDFDFMARVCEGVIQATFWLANRP